MAIDQNAGSIPALLREFLTAERIKPSEAFAQLLGIKPETEAQMRARRQSPPFFRAGSSTFYRFEDVADWLKRNRVECAAQRCKRQAPLSRTAISLTHCCLGAFLSLIHI